MADKLKYPIGTMIRYIGCCPKCRGQTGKIVAISSGLPIIILPQSACNSFNRNGTIQCSWSHIELFIKKNEQLEFAFMRTSD